MISLGPHFDFSRFDSSRAIGNAASLNLLEYGLGYLVDDIVDRKRTRDDHPVSNNRLASRCKTDLSWLALVDRCGTRCGRSDEIVGQKRCPQLSTHHLGRLAANAIQIQIRFNAANVQFNIPAKPIQLGNGFFGVLARIGQAGDHR